MVVLCKYTDKPKVFVFLQEYFKEHVYFAMLSLHL